MTPLTFWSTDLFDSLSLLTTSSILKGNSINFIHEDLTSCGVMCHREDSSVGKTSCLSWVALIKLCENVTLVIVL